MKKLFYVSILGIASLTACGPSAEELAKKAQATADSLAAVAKTQMTADSLAQVAAADSLKKVAEEARLKAFNDSVAAVAEAEAAKKGGKKK